MKSNCVYFNLCVYFSDADVGEHTTSMPISATLQNQRHQFSRLE